MEVITGPQLAKFVGLKRRQIANLARRKKEDGGIPGVFRPHGYQFRFRLTTELRKWIKAKRQQVRKSRRPRPIKLKRNVGIITIHGIRQEFDIWLRRIKPELENMDFGELEEIHGELIAFVEFNEKLVAFAGTKFEG